MKLQFRHNKTTTIFFPKVKQQLFIAFILITLIPIVLVSVISISNARKQLIAQYQSLVNAEVTRINSTLFDITTSMYTSCEPILSSNSYKKIFVTDSFDAETAYTYTALENLLETMHNSMAAISTIRIYTDNPYIPTGSYIISSAENYMDQEWYKKLATAPNKMSHWDCTDTLINQLNQTSYELTLIRRFALSATDRSAYLVITLSSNYLNNRLLYTDHFVLAAVGNSPTFLSSERDIVKNDFPFPEDFEGGYLKYAGSIDRQNGTELCSISTFAPYMTNDKFYILVASPTAYMEVSRLTRNYCIISCIACIFPSLLLFIFASYFSTRVNTLRQAMHQASLGDYNIIDSFHGNDELGQTFTDLQTTVNLIQNKEEQIYAAQLAEQKLINQQQQMEFKMLASQINPHFLYNTLETIRMQALNNNDHEVAKSVKLLGKSMHYVLENTGTNATTLDRELDYVKVYLTIQQLRFPSRVNYAIHIEDGLIPAHYKILPLLLQPIVENAVNHGLEGIKKNGMITIEVFTTEDSLLQITITDNGKGMSDETLQNLKNQIIPDAQHPDNTESIGLYNINQRIKLFYGKQYSLQITSQMHHGTTVTLILPEA